MDPTIFDLTVNSQDLNTVGNTTSDSTTTASGQTTAQDVLNRLDEPHTGPRLRPGDAHPAPGQGRPFRLAVLHPVALGAYQNGAWAPYDFDRTHLVNLVGGLRLPRNWDVGVRLQYQSGKPATTTYGYNTARTNGYDRIDIRVDKRAVYRGWLLISTSTS